MINPLGKARLANINHLTISLTSIDYIIYFSIIFFFAVTRVTSVPSVFLSLVGAYFFLAVPYVVGKCLLIFLEKKLRSLFGLASQYFIEWIAGIVFVTVILAFSQFIGFSFMNVCVGIGLVIISIFINVIYAILKRNTLGSFVVANNVLYYLVISVIVGLLVVAIIKIFFLPLPSLGFNFDAPYTTFTAIDRFVNAGYVTLTWVRWTEFALGGVICSLLNLSPLYFMAAAPFALSVLFSSGVYLLAFHFLKSSKIALLSVFFSVFINVGSIPNSLFVDNSAYVYRSNTIIAALFPIALFFIVHAKSKQGFSKKQSLIFSAVLFLATALLYVFCNVSWIHVEEIGLPVGYLGYVVFPIVDLVIFGILVFCCFIYRNNGFILTIFSALIVLIMFSLTHSIELIFFGLFLSLFMFSFVFISKIIRMISLLIIYTTGLFCILQASGSITRPLGLTLLNQALSSEYSITGFSDKWLLMFNSNSIYVELTLLAFFALSVVFLLFEKDTDKLAFLSLTWLALLIFFLPEFFTYRIYHVLTPLLGLTFAYVIRKLTIIAISNNWRKKAKDAEFH
jgi:hypothetical protein